jgi:hypothetical protein
MKINLSKIGLFVLVVLPLKAFALAGQLSSPSLAFPAEFPEASRTNILAALTHPDYKFISGAFVNGSTQLRYSGDTKALNLFLKRIAKCQDAVLSITFVPRIEMDPAASWSVFHTANGGGGQLEVQVSLHAAQIHLEELAIPEIKGRKDR